MSSVLQRWVQELSWKKQTVLLTAIRCPDIPHPLQLKRVTVWIRATVLEDADPLSGFMHKALRELPLFSQIDRDFERLPLHTAHHIQLAMQVIGNEHFETTISEQAYHFYCEIVNALHLRPEPFQLYEARMADNVDRVETGTS